MTRQALAILIAGFFTVFIAYAIRYGYGMLLPAMLPSLGISKTQAGVIYASYFALYTICSPILGLLSDRYNVRVLLTLFTALLAAGALLMAAAASVLSAAIFFAIAGIGHAACWAPVVALVQKRVPDERRGTALAITTMGSAIGIVVWSLALPLIVGVSSWQAGWISLGLFALGVAGLNGVLVRSRSSFETNQQGPSPDSARRDNLLLAYGKLLQERQLWLIGLSYLLVGFTVLVPYTFLSTYATEALHLPYAVSTRFVAVIAFTGMAGKLVLGIWSDTVGRVRMMMLCGLLMGAGCWIMASFKSVGAIYFASGIFGLGFGAVWPVYAAAAPDFFDKRAAGSVIGLWTVFLGVGSIVAPIMCGYTIDRTGVYHWAFYLGLISAVVSALFLLPLLKAGKQAAAVRL